jgi:hypothetical protein
MVWDPWLIVCLQCLYHLTLSMLMSLIGTCALHLNLLYLFDFAMPMLRIPTDKCVITLFLLAAVIGVGFMLYVIDWEANSGVSSHTTPHFGNISL